MAVTITPVPLLLRKIGNQVKVLYNNINSVLYYEREKYFLITLKQKLQQLLKKKEPYFTWDKKPNSQNQ